MGGGRTGKRLVRGWSDVCAVSLHALVKGRPERSLAGPRCAGQVRGTTGRPLPSRWCKKPTTQNQPPQCSAHAT